MREQHAYVHHPEILQLVRRPKAELHVPAADHADDQTVWMCFKIIGDPAGESTVPRLLSPHETIELRSRLTAPLDRVVCHLLWRRDTGGAQMWLALQA
jgi:hypothetical protein